MCLESTVVFTNHSCGTDLEEDQGWKNLHTDVFRFPAYKSLLCAFLGNGVQFLTLSTVLILMALSGAFHVHHHGSMNTAGIMVYVSTVPSLASHSACLLRILITRCLLVLLFSPSKIQVRKILTPTTTLPLYTRDCIGICVRC